MKQGLFTFLVSALMLGLGIYGAFYSNVPVDNQIGFAVMGCIGAAAVIVIVVERGFKFLKTNK